MKKYIVLMFLALIPVMMMATTIYVDDEYEEENCGGHDWGEDAFDNIQDAINVFETGDVIHVYPYSTGEWPIQNYLFCSYTDLHIIGIGDVTLRGDTNAVSVFYIDNDDNPLYTITLENLTLDHANNGKLIYCLGDDRHTSLNFSECTFTNYGASMNADMIHITNAFEVSITDCIFENVPGGGNAISFGTIKELTLIDNQFTGGPDYPVTGNINGSSYYPFYSLIEGNISSDCRRFCSINCVDYDVQLEISNNLVYDIQDVSATECGYAMYLCTDGDDDVAVSVYNNTFIPDPGNTYDVAVFGIATNEFPDTDITNNIFYGFDYFIEDDDDIPAEFDIDYNCCNITLNDVGAGDLHNITDDPEFEDAGSDEYDLAWNSPCMDAGDPTFSLDVDGTISDMGALVAREHDNVSFALSQTGNESYNWVGFPRLDFGESENEGDFVEATDMLEYFTYPDPVYPPTDIDLWFHDSPNRKFYGDWDGYYEYYIWSEDPCDDLINSTRGFKFKVWDSGTVTNLRVFGDVIASSTDITFDVTYLNNWFCYFLEDVQNGYDAIDDDTLRNLKYVTTKTWTAVKSNDVWTWPSPCLLKYGDLVVLTNDGQVRPFDFQWQRPARTDVEPYERPVPTQFSYNEKIEYLPVFMDFNGNAPLEVAVYVDNVCKGAEVVDNDSLFQLRAYVLEEDPGYELEFVAYYGRSQLQVMDYSIQKEYNIQHTDKLITGNLGDYAFIEFGEPLSDQVPELDVEMRTYPNPFNPSVMISFQTTEFGNIDLDIYNAKGQKVKTLLNNHYCELGDRIEKVWNGYNDQGQLVSGGVYFVRMQSASGIQMKKIVLLK
ncbi:MAG: T9SS type A sorting domain-containing protein [Candidatus Cloacimonetes bacterium]|nr:T9SS type A sorting domain-containing protein [Candidatus Cloacimonadota bacterium]